MNREVHVRFWESAGVRFHCATHLPPCLRERERCPRRHRPIHQLLQLAPAALKPSSSNSGRGVLRIAASAFGRSSLTPQGPLKNYRDLFRSTGPALGHCRARRDRYQFCCWCGHEWDAIAESVCQGAWCQACARRKKRLSIEDARKAAHARGGQCLSTAYVNNSTKMSWLCDRGHVWQTAFAVVRTGKWCPTCANMARITNAKSKARQRYENAGHLGL